MSFLATLFEEDELFDFDDDRLLPKLEELFVDHDKDLTNSQRPGKIAIAPNQRRAAVSLAHAKASTDLSVIR